MELKATVLMAFFCNLVISGIARAQEATVIDYYSPIVNWASTSNEKVAPIHISLLPSGDVYFMSPRFVMTPSSPYISPPQTVMVDIIDSPLPEPQIDPDSGLVIGKGMVCGGHALTSEGELFIASGTYSEMNQNDPNPLLGAVVKGIAESFSFDYNSRTYTQNPNAVGIGREFGKPLRWYGTVTRLADSRMLLTGGYENVLPLEEGQYNNSLEVFDHSTNQWSVVSDYNNTPLGLENPDYTHVFQFPYNIELGEIPIKYSVVSVIGGSGEPKFMLLNGNQSYWHSTENYRPGAKEYIDANQGRKVFPNHGSSSAMLPIRLPESSWGYNNGSILQVGGAHHTPLEGNIDVYDPIDNLWRESISMGFLRHHASTIILPDGRILILAGHDDEDLSNPNGYAQYVDPKNNFSIAKGASYMPESRGYHTVTVLLPDGRVIIGGGNERSELGNEKPNFRYYYPDYFFKQRPHLVYAPETINIGQYFPVLVPHNTDVDEMALVSLGAMTHSFDMSQRHIQLRKYSQKFIFKVENNQFLPSDEVQCAAPNMQCFDLHYVQGPETLELASAGHYMLFLLDRERVPSIGKILKLNR